MWVSIAAWVVVVASWQISLRGHLALASRPGNLDIELADGSVHLASSRYFVSSGPAVVLRSSSVTLRRNREDDFPWPTPLLPVMEKYTASTAGRTSDSLMVWIPAWYFAVPPTLAFFILHRRDRRVAHRLKHNLCTRCGYSRAGIAEGAPCPECGH